MKRIFKVTITAFVLLCLLCSIGISSLAAYENTHINTGDALEDIIAVAKTQLGYMEGSLEGTVQKNDDVTKYGEWYGMNGQAWCAMFVSWCADQAKIPTNIIPKHASCDVGMQWFISKNGFEYSDYYGGSYTPKRGDIVYFGYQMTSGAFDSNHVGIVYKVENSKIYVYEGNSSAKVQSVSYKMSENQYILGYGLPQYQGYTPPVYEPGNYLVNTAWLNFRSEPNTSGEKLELLTRDTLLEITEISENGWGKTTYNGKQGWLSLEYCKRVYLVEYVGNGGKNIPDTQYKSPKQELTISDALPTKDGYEFAGWATEKNGAAVYAPGSIYTEDKDITLYALWSANSFTVSYNANGGENAPKSQIKGVDTSLQLSSQTPTRKGYGFFGWSLTPEGEASYMPGDIYKENKSVTLYAVWKKEAVLESYTITFDANGGENAPASQPKTQGEDITLSSQAPKRSNYSFEGWALTKNAKWCDYRPGDVYNTDESATLYALWTKSLPNLTLSAGKGGYVSKRVESGTLYIRITADEGNAISQITVNSAPQPLLGDNSQIELSFDSTKTLKIAVSFTDNSGLWINPYTDVKQKAWYFEAVSFCYTKGIMKGKTESTFAPAKSLTRAEFITILGRSYEASGGVIACNGTVPFTDISTKGFYYSYLCWAYNNKIVTGTSATKFSPNANLTREQLCVMLMNYASFNGKVDDFNYTLVYGYSDSAKISSWAFDAMNWALDQRIINGSGGKLTPKSTATRAQAATVIMNSFDIINAGTNQ